ncbi:MAG: efflux RND transporter periplasmic adaptor subunit [Planctomycetota bacterium]|jgi:RND family efflux transporter MFP subunit|nr:efflux RND transporter periplasmic adaptor subunit [Planctomycetota bacterium]
MTSHRSPFLSFLLVVIAVTLCLVAIYGTRPDPPRPMAPTPSPAPVVIRNLELQERALDVRVWGNLEAWQEATLAAEQAGKVVWKKPGLEMGDHVQVGETLFRLDPKPFELAVQRTQAAHFAAVAAHEAQQATVLGARRALHSARQQETLAERELQRVTLLERKGDASASRLDQAEKARVSAVAARENTEYSLASSEAALRASSAQSEEAAAALATAQDALERSSILAPFDGEVGSIFVDAGDWLGPGAPALHLIDRSRLRATLQVPTDDVAGIQKAGAVLLKTGTLLEAKGKVLGVNPTVHRESRSQSVVVEVPNPLNTLSVGMHVSATIFKGAKSALWLRPAEYSLFEGIPTAWALSSDSKQVHPSPLKLGRPLVDSEDRTWLPVLSGLSVGQSIATTNLEVLTDGALVEVVQH